MPAYRGSLQEGLNARTRYTALIGALKSERSSFDSHWTDLGDYYMPRRYRFWAGDRNKGDKRNQKIIDSTGRFAARTLSSGMHAGLTSPARPWMKLTTHDPKLAKLPSVKTWLAESTQRMLTLFATSNLYNVLPLCYIDMGIFATAAMSMVKDDRDTFRCYSYPIGSYMLGQDDRGKTSTFAREYEMTVEQVVEQFGVQENGIDIDWTTISDAVKNAWDRGSYTTAVQVTWIVTKNRDYDSSKLEAKYKLFKSCYFETNCADKPFLRESGFDTFPIMAPRWDITGEDAYGTDCPGMTVLGDTKQLQIMEKRKGQLLAKAVDPPLVGPSSLRAQKTSLIPGDVTFQDVREGMKGLMPIHEVRLEGFQHISASEQEVRQRIQRGFFEDLFLMLARSDETGGLQPITAREVEERHQEKLLALGPVLERTNDELLDPIVDRAFAMMEAAGLIEPAPAELKGVLLKVEYTSILADAQKLVGVVGLDRFLQSTGGMAQLWPETRHKVDVFKAVDLYADMLGVDPGVNRSDADARASLQQEQQAMQASEQAKNAAMAARATRDAAASPLTGDTVLSQLVQGQGSGVPPAPVGAAPATPAGG